MVPAEPAPQDQVPVSESCAGGVARAGAASGTMTAASGRGSAGSADSASVRCACPGWPPGRGGASGSPAPRSWPRTKVTTPTAMAATPSSATGTLTDGSIEPVLPRRAPTRRDLAWSNLLMA